MGSTSKSMHREVQIKYNLMTRKCKYTLNLSLKSYNGFMTANV